MTASVPVPGCGAPPFEYSVYGVSLRSEIPLQLPTRSDAEPLAEIELRTASAEWFEGRIQGAPLHQAPDSWYRHALLPDSANYARWVGVGEFLVPSDGKTIYCRQAADASFESFHVYLLGQALSFALVRQGFEPLHATAIVVHGEAVVFLGDSGFGKSTLAACFLAAGHRLLTDDLLIFRLTPRGVLAYPGPSRIKLFARMARRFLGSSARGVPMNSSTRKMILPLDGSQVCVAPVPISAVYSLAAPHTVFREQAIQIDQLSPREAFLELVSSTFNYRITDARRLERQFHSNVCLLGAAPVYRLTHPRSMNRVTEVRDAVLTHCGVDSRESGGVGEHDGRRSGIPGFREASCAG